MIDEHSNTDTGGYSAQGRRAMWACLFAGLVVAILAALHLARDPNTVLLLGEGGAEWLQPSEPTTMGTWPPGTYQAAYRASIVINEQPARADLHFRILKQGEIYVDGAKIFSTTPGETWKQTYTVDLAPYLAPGPHDIGIVATNDMGRPCILAYVPELDLRTGPGWAVTRDGANWVEARLARDVQPIAAFQDAPSPVGSFVRLLPAYLPIALLVGFLSVWKKRPEWFTAMLGPRPLRVLLMVAVAVLGLNNLVKLPLTIGYDKSAHLEYIQYVAQHWRVPLANEGWQMFQSPLYYILSSMLLRVSSVLASPEIAERLLRLIPIACSVLQVEIAYRFTRILFPERNDLQRVGMLIGGLMPMNLYLAQVIGNESMGSVFVACGLCLLARYVQTEQLTRRFAATIGCVLGAALLTKFTAVLLLPLLLVAIGLVAFASPRLLSAIRAQTPMLYISVPIAAVIAGWYYARNWWVLGRPFIGGWDPARGILWWQDPGFRTISQFTQFGEAFTHPLYASAVSFWDGFYGTMFADGMLHSAPTFDAAPGWNYSIMLSGLVLAIVPTLMIATGALLGVRAIIQGNRRGLAFATIALALFLCAALQHALANPAFCAIKGFYTLGALPCYAALAAAGYGLIARNTILRAMAMGMLVCWCVASYATYFVL